MDVLISLVLGVIALAALSAWIMAALGVGSQFDPLLGVLGAPIIRLSRSFNARRHQQSLKTLPAGVPPPPPGP